jgi:hypothetical protein
MRTRTVVLLCSVVAVIAGLFGGLVATGLAEGPQGSAGEQGPAGDRGPAGPAGETPSSLGVCFDASYDVVGDSTGIVTDVELYAPIEDDDGTISCPSGRYVPAVPQDF